MIRAHQDVFSPKMFYISKVQQRHGIVIGIFGAVPNNEGSLLWNNRNQINAILAILNQNSLIKRYIHKPSLGLKQEVYNK